mgnify:CR=1 FL=1
MKSFSHPSVVQLIGSGEGATSLRADRFVLASRSDYFRACLRLGESSFQEGAAGRVTLDVPSPQPSAAASRAVLEVLWRTRTPTCIVTDCQAVCRIVQDIIQKIKNNDKVWWPDGDECHDYRETIVEIFQKGHAKIDIEWMPSHLDEEHRQVRLGVSKGPRGAPRSGPPPLGSHL